MSGEDWKLDLPFVFHLRRPYCAVPEGIDVGGDAGRRWSIRKRRPGRGRLVVLLLLICLNGLSWRCVKGGKLRRRERPAGVAELRGC